MGGTPRRPTSGLQRWSARRFPRCARRACVGRIVRRTGARSLSPHSLWENRHLWANCGCRRVAGRSPGGRKLHGQKLHSTDRAVPPGCSVGRKTGQFLGAWRREHETPPFGDGIGRVIAPLCCSLSMIARVRPNLPNLARRARAAAVRSREAFGGLVAGPFSGTLNPVRALPAWNLYFQRGVHRTCPGRRQSGIGFPRVSPRKRPKLGWLGRRAATRADHAPLAQLDRASVYGTEG